MQLCHARKRTCASNEFKNTKTNYCRAQASGKEGFVKDRGNKAANVAGRGAGLITNTLPHRAGVPYMPPSA